MLYISCLGFARLQAPDGTYAVIVNEGRRVRHGELTLSPIGGALKLTDAGKLALKSFGARPVDGGDDLRFRIPHTQAKKVIAWFIRRENSERETSVLREAQEELVGETRTLWPRALQGAKDALVNFTYVKLYLEGEALYLMETYELSVSTSVMRQLQSAAQLPTSRRRIYFVTPEEIKARKTCEGITIGPFPQYMLPG